MLCGLGHLYAVFEHKELPHPTMTVVAQHTGPARWAAVGPRPPRRRPTRHGAQVAAVVDQGRRRHRSRRARADRPGPARRSTRTSSTRPPRSVGRPRYAEATARYRRAGDHWSALARVALLV
ncbi:hypothetical protein ACFQV2_28840 [Actinokineospora soli]|uniref:Uncharacterized protein n=1 Tax=Actinokineospora soli TaxID=1048753 RepID=A0ABW2TV95_9PSEU